MNNKYITGLFGTILVSLSAHSADSPIPDNPTVATWVYNTTWPSQTSGAMPWDKAGDIDDLWVDNLSCYNGLSSACTSASQPGNPGVPGSLPPSFATNNNPVNQIIYYGGDLEAYCDGTGQALDDIDQNGPWTCVPNAFYTSYYGPYMGLFKIGDPTVDTSPIMLSDIKKWSNTKTNTFTIHDTCDNFDGKDCTVATTNFWETYVAGDIASRGSQKGAHTTSGFRAGAEYSQVYMNAPNAKPVMVADIDGRLDVANLDDDFLDGLNVMSQADAGQLADFIAKNICADDRADGVQFDLEPFDFGNTTGRLNNTNMSSIISKYTSQLSASGQQYFYTQIAKDFAGYHGNPDDPAGINNTLVKGEYTDPLHCVDRAHPNGRFFSVFTFSGHVTPAVVTVFTHHNNGLIVDSLYDLTTSLPVPEPGGSPTCPTVPVTVNVPGHGSQTYPPFQLLVRAEIAKMKSLGVPYQFGIPVGASAHEFETSVAYNSSGAKTTTTATFGASGSCAAEPVVNQNQGGYVSVALNELKNGGVLDDPNYRGIAAYGWSQQSWWTDVSDPAAPYYELQPDYPNIASLTALAQGPSVGGSSAPSGGTGATGPIRAGAEKAALAVWVTQGAGSVTSDDGYIHCGNTCQKTYKKGASIILRAHADTGDVFAGWSGACSGKKPECKLKVGSNKLVKARFVQKAG